MKWRGFCVVLLVMLWPLLDAVAANQRQRQEVLNHLKTICLAIAQYYDDYNGMPDMNTPNALMKAVLQHTGDSKRVFHHPRTGEAFVPVAGPVWQQQATAALVYEATPEDGRRAVAFTDGHVEDMAEEDWQQLREKQRIPLGKRDLVWSRLSNLRLLGEGILEYVKAGDKTLPPLNDAAALRKVLLPYTQMKDVLNHPDTQQPYGINIALAGRKFAEITNPGQIVIFFETSATNDTRGVLFLDGQVERVPEAKWSALKKQSGID